MDDRQFERELRYQVSMSIVRQMLEAGMIDVNAYAKWQEKLIALYDPPIGRIVSNPTG